MLRSTASSAPFQFPDPAGATRMRIAQLLKLFNPHPPPYKSELCAKTHIWRISQNIYRKHFNYNEIEIHSQTPKLFNRFAVFRVLGSS